MYVDEDVATLIPSHVVISDSDVAEGDGTVAVTVAASSGTLSLTAEVGVTYGGDATSVVSLDGPLADVVSSLDTLVYVSSLHFVGNVTLNVTVSDKGNTGASGVLYASEVFTVSVLAVNDAPTLSLATRYVSTFEDFETALASNLIVVSDVDAGSGEVNVTLGVAAGTLRLETVSGLSVAPVQPSASLFFVGPLSAVNGALGSIVYVSARAWERHAECERERSVGTPGSRRPCLLRMRSWLR